MACLRWFLPHEHLDDDLDRHLRSVHRQAGVQEKAAERRLRKDDPDLLSREEGVRMKLKNAHALISPESGIDPSELPRHVAVVMDGNRRYGKAKYGNAKRGHWDGSSKLVDFARWCIAERISVLTVYAFSTENWNRQPDEIASLMSIFTRYCEELRVEALERNIRIIVLSTEAAKVSGTHNDGVRNVQETGHILMQLFVVHAMKRSPGTFVRA